MNLSALNIFAPEGWKKELKEIILIALFGIPWAFLWCRQCTDYSISIIISSTVWVVMWKGNSYVSCLIDLKYQWLKQPVHRLITGLIGHTIFTAVAMYCLYYFYHNLFDIRIGNVNKSILISIGITFLISLILHSREFLISWRQLAIESERMNKEIITAKYEALKNQVNPHFLFNSFNVLTNLVFEDQNLAAKFIKKLSEVYRYVLDSREKEIVPLNEEVDFVKSYIFLQKIRHSEGLNVNIEIPENTKYGIAPLALQMLMENAIKHNVVSEESPLNIDVKIEGGFLIVSNNIQKKNILKEDSSGVGIENIKARYNFLSDKSVMVSEVNDEYKVQIPLIDLNNAGINN